MTKKVAAVTGGAGHLGRSICEKLAAGGLDIVVIDKNSEAGKSFVDALERRYQGAHRFIAADVSEENAFVEIKAEITRGYSRLDYLINNAAFYDDTPGWGVPFEEEGYEAWLKVLRVNLLAPFFLVQALYPLLQQSAYASVVNIGSIYNVVGPDHRLYEGLSMTNPAAYSASKGGLLQVTRWLSTVLAPKVRVNMVSPGGLKRDQAPTFVSRYSDRTPLQRMANEADVAGVVAFLLSSEAAYMTGQNVVVDGGWTVW